MVKALSTLAANLVIITTTDQIEHEHKTKYAPIFIGTIPGLKITKTPIKPVSYTHLTLPTIAEVYI